MRNGGNLKASLIEYIVVVQMYHTVQWPLEDFGTIEPQESVYNIAMITPTNLSVTYGRPAPHRF